MLKRNELPIINKDFVDNDENEKEYIIFKLRETEGINLEVFRDKYGIDFLEKYKDQINKFKDDGFFEIDKAIKFTKKGMSLSNEFFVEII